VGEKAKRPWVARGCVHDNPSREGAAQWRMNTRRDLIEPRQHGGMCAASNRSKLHDTGLVMYFGVLFHTSLLFSDRLKLMHLQMTWSL
jgi:hypothetical protein